MNTMMESNEVILGDSPEVIWQFLTDFRNYEQLMPSSISQWQSDKGTCQFSIQGAGILSLKFGDLGIKNSIQIIPGDKVPFPFVMTWFCNELKNGQTSVKLTMEANLNIFLKSVIKGRLEPFLTSQVNKLEHIFPQK